MVISFESIPTCDGQTDRQSNDVGDKQTGAVTTLISLTTDAVTCAATNQSTTLDMNVNSILRQFMWIDIDFFRTGVTMAFFYNSSRQPLESEMLHIGTSVLALVYECVSHACCLQEETEPLLVHLYYWMLSHMQWMAFGSSGLQPAVCTVFLPVQWMQTKLSNSIHWLINTVPELMCGLWRVIVGTVSIKTALKTFLFSMY